MPENSFGAKDTLQVGGREYEVFRLDALQQRFDVARLPFSLKVLLESLLRTEGNGSVVAPDIEALAGWDPSAESDREIAFSPARVLMQDFTGVPAVVDLAAMRDAMTQMGGDPNKINPLVPAELVIDHSVQVDAFGTHEAFRINAEREFERNRERYAFLRWGQGAFDNFAVVPPDTGIVHQVNLEYLARVVFSTDVLVPGGAGPSAEKGAAGKTAGGGVADGAAAGEQRPPQAYPDTLVGTDSHTTMVNGLGVLGWGVGGIEAEAAMLGQPMSMLIPQVLGFKLHGSLREGATATDLVLTVTQMLRERGVVGMFVEFYGQGVASLPIADRATLGNMSPEFGSTCAIFPIDSETLRYLALSGRPAERIELVEAYAREQGLWHDESSEEPSFSDLIELDLGEVVPSIAGPKRPQDRISLTNAKAAFRHALRSYAQDADGLDEALAGTFPASDPTAVHRPPKCGEEDHKLDHGDVVIAAITSCTNTSNPAVMIGAGILARNARERGLQRKPWVKTSLAPGSKVVSEYLDRTGLTSSLEQLGFNLVGYGCTTCIGNSGPLPQEISAAVDEGGLAVASVLSGNRNFEGRINPDVKMNYLASPPLVVAYAIAGTMDIDIASEPLGRDARGQDVYLRDIWPSEHEVAQTVERAINSDMFHASYSDLFAGDERWASLDVPSGERFAWDERSTYVREPPYFQGMPAEPEPVADLKGARVLALLGDSVTTDHISPAGSIKRDGPAGAYLQEHGVTPRDFNSYGSRRGNHEVMMRGTFANIRLRNLLGGRNPLPEGGVTLHLGRPGADTGADVSTGAAPGADATPRAGVSTGAAPGADATPGATPGAGEQMSIYDAAMRYAAEGVPLVVIGGKEYGSGSSRDWAAKGTRLLGVHAVIAESFERIHRSNLIGMGVLPLQFPAGESSQSLGIDGREPVDVEGFAEPLQAGKLPRTCTVRAGDVQFEATVRIDTPKEADYFRHGGILQYVLRQLLAS
jgi:aconitate hydratase